MPAGRLSSDAGYTLLEVMLAVALVIFGMLGLVNVQSRFFASSQEMRVYTAALNFAQDKQEGLRYVAAAEGFDKLAAGEDSCDPTAVGSVCAGLGVLLQRRWERTPCPQALACKAVTTEVSWDAAGAPHKLHLTSYIAQPLLAGSLGIN